MIWGQVIWGSKFISFLNYKREYKSKLQGSFQKISWKDIRASMVTKKQDLWTQEGSRLHDFMVLVATCTHTLSVKDQARKKKSQNGEGRQTQNSTAPEE